MDRDNALRNISKNELATYQEIFSLFDKEDTGLIPINQVPLFIRGLGHCPTETELKQIISKLESNQQGTVSFTDLIIILEKRNKQINIQEEILDAFEGIQNQIGGGGNSDSYKMSIHGVKKYLTDLGEGFSQMQLEQFVQFLEQNNLKQQTDFKFRDFAKILAYEYLK